MLLLLTAVSVLLQFSFGQQHPTSPATYRSLPSLREQARILNEWRAERLAWIPELFEKYNVDVWLMSQREYAEDTVWFSLKNALSFAPHRRTVMLLHRNASIATPSLLRPNPMTWVDNTGDVWPELRAMLEELNPTRIALNTDRDIAFGGGLHVGELEVLREHLGDKWMSRVVNEPMLGVEYVARRVPGQIMYYRRMQESIWAMLEEAFSERVIDPGVTTTADIEWWFRDKMQEQNVSTWNHPRVSVLTPESFPGWEGTDDVIQEGDLLHVDFGMTAMNMNTDTQHMAYVLRTSEGETAAPVGVEAGLRKSNRMQDIQLEVMRPGITGNQVLRACLAKMKEEGIEGQVYSHPIGDWGHAPGAVMGFTNLPTYVPVLGELPVLPNTFYSIELYAYHYIPERNETIRYRQEEDVYWVEEKQGWQWVYGRQEHLHLINGANRPVEKPVLMVQ
ncbi:hypothetical protein OF83DRAFT_1050268 [Amylostereum chailletii]|nr:hypothetical protein OF83DRAFT_1050268 [Amylostereum chailletii]